VIFPPERSHAQSSQFNDGRSGSLCITGGVSDQQLERSSDDPAGIIDVTSGQLESSEQMSARLDPTGPSERNESADLDCRFISHPVSSAVA
jgi:hypothetical protein